MFFLIIAGFLAALNRVFPIIDQKMKGAAWFFVVIFMNAAMLSQTTGFKEGVVISLGICLLSFFISLVILKFLKKKFFGAATRGDVNGGKIH